MLIFGLILSVLLIVVGTSYWRIHPFLVLLFVSLFFGVWVRIPLGDLVERMQQGFGHTLGKIGLLVLMGVLIGTFLEKSGGAYQIAKSILRLTGLKKLPWALSGLGFLIAIPVFVDAGFVLLQGLNRVLSRQAGVALVTTTTALAMGLMTSHCLIPPTPGPLAATGLLGADMGLVLGFGVGIGLLAQIPTILYSHWLGRSAADMAFDACDHPPDVWSTSLPPLSKSLLPIGLPLVLIMTKSAIPAAYQTATWYPLLQFLGTPFIALGLGFLTSLTLPAVLERRVFSAEGWVGDAFRESSDILLVTGAGGMFGFVLQSAHLGETLLNPDAMRGWGLWVPFGVAFLLKTVQGSSTVAMLTAASLIAPLMPALGLTSPVAVALSVLAVGSGAIMVSHVNDSYFWVVTRLSGQAVSVGLRSHSIASALTGVSAMLLCWLAWLVWG